MTLTEYLNQKDPVYMPHVELRPGEYELGVKIRDMQQVFIPAINSFVGKNAEYVKFDDSDRLRSCDEDGNPIRLSCFYIR